MNNLGQSKMSFAWNTALLIKSLSALETLLKSPYLTTCLTLLLWLHVRPRIKLAFWLRKFTFRKPSPGHLFQLSMWSLCILCLQTCKESLLNLLIQRNSCIRYSICILLWNSTSSKSYQDPFKGQAISRTKKWQEQIAKMQRLWILNRCKRLKNRNPKLPLHNLFRSRLSKIKLSK